MKRLVIAGAHGPVAREDNPQRFIGSEPFEIEETSYYLRRFADGELVDAPVPASAVLAEAPPKKHVKKGDE